jgi:glyoxylase-like metal-dependent hydrolase (beta-lactamase superfamily II)
MTQSSSTRSSPSTRSTPWRTGSNASGLINLIGIYITHGHADHWIGLSRLLEHFPHARGLATAEAQARAQFEATDPGLSGYWKSIFPDETPATPVLPELLTGDTIELEESTLQVRSIGQGDTERSTLLVPEIDAVVAGDIVYNQVHMMTGETDAASRLDWIASLDAIQALDPDIVVAGHKRVDEPDSPQTIEQTQQYLRDFSQIAAEQHTVQEIVDAMLARHPNRDNPRALWHSARIAAADQPDER